MGRGRRARQRQASLCCGPATSRRADATRSTATRPACSTHAQWRLRQAWRAHSVEEAAKLLLFKRRRPTALAVLARIVDHHLRFETRRGTGPATPDELLDSRHHRHRARATCSPTCARRTARPVALPRGAPRPRDAAHNARQSYDDAPAARARHRAGVSRADGRAAQPTALCGPAHGEGAPAHHRRQPLCAAAHRAAGGDAGAVRYRSRRRNCGSRSRRTTCCWG